MLTQAQAQPLPSTQPTPAQATPKSGIAIYDGMRVYARGLALAATVRDEYYQRIHGFEGRGWRRHPKVPSVWVNARHLDHIAYRVAEEGGWRVVQRVRGRAALPALQAAADSLAGKAATLISASVFSRALRTRITLLPGTSITLGTDPARCRPFGPSWVREIEGLVLEHRLARTTDSNGKYKLYAEVFVTPNKTVDGEPRAVLYLADGRRVLSAVMPNAAAALMAQLLDSMFLWISGLREQGVVPDDHPLRLPQVAVARAVEGAARDIFFDAELPGPEPSDTRRIATCASGGFMPIESAADRDLVFGGLAEEPGLLARPGLHSRGEVLAELMGPHRCSA